MDYDDDDFYDYSPNNFLQGTYWFQEGQSAPQTPQPFFDADFEGLASNAELYIFNQDDSQE